MHCNGENLKTYLWKHKFLPALGNEHILPHWFQGNKGCATPKPFTAPTLCCLRHQVAFLPPCVYRNSARYDPKDSSVARVNSSRGEHLWSQGAPQSQGGPWLPALGEQCAQAEQKLSLGGWHKTQLGGKQIKTDVVKGIQISSIFQARSQDSANFWTHPTEILPKSPCSKICQIHKTISRAATQFVVLAHANACLNSTIFIPDNLHR